MTFCTSSAKLCFVFTYKHTRHTSQTWSDNVAGDEKPILTPWVTHDTSAASSNTWASGR